MALIVHFCDTIAKNDSKWQLAVRKNSNLGTRDLEKSRVPRVA